MVLCTSHVSAMQETYKADLVKGANAGDPESQFGLALLYEHGSEGVERNPEKALVWLEKAGQAAVPAACLYLGLKYEYGNRVKKDFKKAACWFECAARQDWPAAQFFLAEMYEEGKGVSRSPHMARMLFGLAAEYNYPAATVNFLRLSAGINDKDMTQLQQMQSLFLEQGGTPCK